MPVYFHFTKSRDKGLITKRNKLTSIFCLNGLYIYFIKLAVKLFSSSTKLFKAVIATATV